MKIQRERKSQKRGFHGDTKRKKERKRDINKDTKRKKKLEKRLLIHTDSLIETQRTEKLRKET